MTEEERPNNDLDLCPDEDLLRRYAEDQLQLALLKSVVEAHLQFCASCSSKVRSLKSRASADDFLKSQANRFRDRAAEVNRAHMQGPQPGTLWRAFPETEDQLYGPLLMVLETGTGRDSKLVKAALVSQGIEQAIQTDMILEPEESGMSFRFMVRAKNVFDTDKDNLKTYAGCLPEALALKVIKFCQVAEDFDQGITLTEYLFGKDYDGTELMYRRGVTSGMLVTNEDDPRLNFLENTKSRCTYLVNQEKTQGPDVPVRKPEKVDSRRTWLRLALPLAASIALAVLAIEFLPQYLTPSSDTRLAFSPTPFETQLKRDYWNKKHLAFDLGANLRDYVAGATFSPEIVYAKIPGNDSLSYSLIGAARSGRRQRVAELLSQGTNINAVDKTCRTPLMIASRAGNKEIVQLLLYVGANTRQRDCQGKTALDWARESGHKDIVRLLSAHQSKSQ